MKLPESVYQSSPLGLHAFVVTYITAKINLITMILNRGTQVLNIRARIPGYRLQMDEDILPISRVLRNSHLSRGLWLYMAELLPAIIDPEHKDPAQVARNQGIKNAYEVAEVRLNGARSAMIATLGSGFGHRHTEVIGDPAQVGIGTFLLRTAMFGEVDDIEQEEAIREWVKEAKREFKRTNGMDPGEAVDSDIDAWILGG